MANESYIERLQREKGLLIEAVLSVMEFHEARGQYDNSPYKYDAGRVVEAKRQTMLAKFAQVEPLLKSKEKTNG